MSSTEKTIMFQILSQVKNGLKLKIYNNSKLILKWFQYEKNSDREKNVEVNILSLVVLQQVLICSVNFQVINTSLNHRTSHNFFMLLPELPPNSWPMCGKQPHDLREEVVAEVGSQRQI